MRKLYTFTCQKTNQKFTDNLTVKQATEIVSLLNYNSENHWEFHSEEEIMKDYNFIVTSPDYKREVEQMKEVYSGSNLNMRVNSFHTRLGIMQLEGRQIFETFKID